MTAAERVRTRKPFIPQVVNNNKKEKIINDKERRKNLMKLYSVVG